MVNPVYDHIVAIVLVGIIFVGTVVAVPAAINYTSFQAVDQQQLRNTALNSFHAMLLGPGAPSNWGSVFPFQASSLSNFGLAQSSAFSKYILDSEKVQRLDPRTPGYLTYNQARDLLQLQGYGFKFSLFRPFRVGWDIDWNTNQVSLSVNTTRTEDNSPIPQAKIRANILATASNVNNDDCIILINNPTTHETDLMGRCAYNEAVNIPSGYTINSALAIMHIDVNGMETIVVAQKDADVQEWLNVNNYGDTLTLTYRGEFFNGSYANGERRITDIFGYDLESLMRIYNGDDDPVTAKKVNNGIGYQYWNNTFPELSAIDPALLLFVVSVPNPRRLVVVAGPFNAWDDDVIFEFGPDHSIGRVLTTMRRFVVISGMTYVTEFILWEE